MAAPSIPNLNALRSGRGRVRGRGTGGSAGAASSPASGSHKAQDEAVQQTDQDASISRLSAVQAGYLDDPYAQLFATKINQRRLPIINRGTYVRTKAIDQLVESFLQGNPTQKKQIISLGAGTDTRYFRLMSQYRIHESPNWIYHEIDFKENAIHKVQPIMKDGSLASAIRSPVIYSNLSGNTAEPACVVDGPFFHTHPFDLRELDSESEPPSGFREIDRTLPTLFLSECCLCYLSPAAADNAARYFTKHFFPESTPVGMVIYEPIKPNDAFGKVMASNLAARGIVMQTLKKYGSLEAQSARLQTYGLSSTRGADVNRLWHTTIDSVEKDRVASLEMVDEVEEWDLLAAHYAVIWGWRDSTELTAFGNVDRWASDVFRIPPTT